MARGFSNTEVAKVLREIAAVYEVKGGSFFQARAYDQAADSVEHATSSVKDLWEDGRLEDLAGVGGSIAQHLDELFKTGKVKHFGELKKGLPKGMFEILDLEGVGPKTAYKLAKKLNVKNISDLKKACEKGKVRELPGFGEKSEAEILKSIKQYKGKTEERLLLPVADSVAQKLIAKLERLPGVKRVDPLGSLRRMVSTVGDVDLAVQSDYPQEVIEAFVSLPDVKRVLSQGEVKAAVVLSDGTQVDLRVQGSKSYGGLLQYFTGSKAHNIHLREIAQREGLSLSEYGIRRGGRGGQLLEFATEEEFYDYLGLPWIPPELREDTGEIEAATKGRLPNLVCHSDIKGDLHLHCNFDIEESHDPGQDSMEGIAQKAESLGYEYVAIGNHSPSVSEHDQAQIRALLLKRQKELDRVQKLFPKIKLLSMIEVDISTNGELALDNESLQLLEVAVAAVHSSMNQPQEKMTDRVLAALNNPYIHGLAHPTGRLLNQREGYELDWEKIFKACVKNHKFLEVNAFYNRLDLPDLIVKEAVSKGVMLAINSDAHRVEHLGWMRYGVATARRGWAQKKDVLNTYPWEKVKAYLSNSSASTKS